MVAEVELRELIEKAQALGALVIVKHDELIHASEGRQVISTVQIFGVKGCGPHPMSPLSAAERLREFISKAGK